MTDSSPAKQRRAQGRSLSDFKLNEPEKKLLEASRTGAGLILDDKAPETSTARNTIRAGFLRFLALGGDAQAPVHEKGVQLKGAFIEGDFDLDGATLPFDLFLIYCSFAQPIILRGALGRTIGLDGSRFQRLDGNRLQLEGNLHLREVRASGQTDLIGARIAGSLECDGGWFANAGGIALLCDGAKIGGAVFLRGGFHATGATRLVGARITSNLECDGAHFENGNGVALDCDLTEVGGSVYLRDGFLASGNTSFRSARVKKNLNCEGGRFDNADHDALSCDRTVIEGAFFFRKYANVRGVVRMTFARVGDLADGDECWPAKALVLDGFRYERIRATSPLDAKTRIAWLDKQQPEYLNGQRFTLQPWVHLASVLREQGHYDEAAEVDIAREDRLRKAGRIAALPSPSKWLRYITTPANAAGDYDWDSATVPQLMRIPNVVPWCLHWFYGWFAGYGYRPWRVVSYAFGAWLFCALIYAYAAAHGAFGPSNPLVFQNPALEHCRPEAKDTPDNKKAKVGNWTTCAEAPGEYTSFNAYIYSLDLILPVVSLGQAADWTPITSGDKWTLGHVVRCVTWFEELFGWVAALTLAAIASGLVKTKDGD